MKNVIILGSGRSGTSMVAGCLAKSGYFMGNQLWDACDSNPKGFFEDREINEINEELLAPHIPKRLNIFGWHFFRQHPAKWQRWLACLPPDFKAEACPAISVRIKKMVERQPYCFKDPRFSYTLSAWAPYLNDTIFICVFREPGKTACSIDKECSNRWYLANPKTGIKVSYDQALKVWSHMYATILSMSQDRERWLFMHYNQVLTEKGINLLEAFTGNKVDRSFPTPVLNRTKSGKNVPETCCNIYRNLCDIAGYENP